MFLLSRFGGSAALVIAIFLSVTTAQAQYNLTQIISDVERSSVRVENETAELFTANAGGGHGTGFIVEIDEKLGVGYIFTNKHVTAKEALETQKIRLQFVTDTDVPEAVTGKLAYVSSVHDFAIVQFQLSDLKRARNIVKVAKLPQMGDFRLDYLRNYKQFGILQVAAYGFPYDGEEITTYGRVNGRKIDVQDGPFIQTQTPINPGNSGGPLVDLSDGTVIGVNSAKLTDADNVGYAIPIGVLLEEYARWKSDPDSLKPNVALALFKLNSTEMLIAEGLAPLIKAQVPTYFENIKTGMLSVRSAKDGTGLKTGDFIVAINGMAIGGSIYNWRLAMQSSASQVKLIIIRDQELHEVVVPVENQSNFERRAELDFVYLSGMLLGEISKFTSFVMDPDLKSSVILRTTFPTPVSKQFEFPPPGSVVIAVKIGTEEFPVAKLLDLKTILNRHRDMKFVKLKVIPSRLMYTAKGAMVQMDQNYGVPVLDNHPKEYNIPVAEIITPLQLSLHRFGKQFGFDPADFATQNWRSFVKPFNPKLCEEILK